MRLCFACVVLVALASCSNQKMANTADGGGGSACANAPKVSLDQLWTRYLTNTPSSGHGGCALSGCHLDGAGGMQFSSPTEFAATTIDVPSSLTAGADRVVPGDPANSVVYQRLQDSAGFGQMPPGGPYLTSSELGDVAGWICAGAPTTSSIDGGVGDGGVVAGDTVPPTFAGAASATGGYNSVTLSWTAATDDVTASSQLVYLVYQASAAGGESYATPTFTTAPGATSFTITKLPVSTKYYYVVRAQDQAGNVDGNTKEVSATTLAVSDTTPPAFAGATGATAAGNTVTLTWTQATDDHTAQSAIVYLVYQSTTAGGESFATPTYTTAPGVGAYTVGGLGVNTKYYFVVRAEDQAGNVDGNTAEVAATTMTVSLANDVQPILSGASGNCALSGCHTGARPAEGLDLSTAAKSYANLVNVLSAECATTKRVAPGDTSASYLAWKLQGSGPCFFGTKMPKTGSLTTAQINTILAWIGEGAPNN